MALKTTANHSETQYYINLQQTKLRPKKKKKGPLTWETKKEKNIITN